MVIMSNCPFCRPGPDEVVVAETPHAIAICDARPLCAGHVLICPRDHFASMIDTPVWALNHVAVLQYEVGRRLLDRFGEVGIYEHGRSSISRFHVASGDFCHAHVHALPVSDDVLRFVSNQRSWGHVPTERELSDEPDYFWQECSSGPVPKWGAGLTPPRNHCVRGLIEKALTARNVRYIPLSAPAAQHRIAIKQTAGALLPVLPHAFEGVSLYSMDRTPLLNVAQELRKVLGWPVIIQDQSRLTPIPVEGLSDHGPTIFISDAGSFSPRRSASLEVIFGDTSLLSQFKSWDFLRVTSTGVEPKALADTVLTALKLRSRELLETSIDSRLCA